MEVSEISILMHLNIQLHGNNMNRILLEIKFDSISIKNVNPKEESVDKIPLNYSILEGSTIKSINSENAARLKDDLLYSIGKANLMDSTVYLIFPQAMFHTFSLPAKQGLSRLQQYNEYKFETKLIFPYLTDDSFSLDVQRLDSPGFSSPDYELITLIDNSILTFAAEIKNHLKAPKTKVTIPFLSLRNFIKRYFPEEQSSVLLHLSGSSIILSAIKGRAITSVYSTNFIDVPSVPDIIDSFLLNNSAGRIDKDTLHAVYFSLEDYMIGLTSLVEKWMNVKTKDSFSGFPLGKVSKIPPDLMQEIRNEA